MLYRKISKNDVDRFTAWAENNNVDYDIWDGRQMLDCTCQQVELGLEQWPTKQELNDGLRTLSNKPR